MGERGFTPTQADMIKMLSDGLPHTRQELFTCLRDDLARLQAINMHLSNCRKILRPRGEDIICELVNRRICYRHVRLLPSAVDGKR